MPNRKSERYYRRFDKVIDYIERHLDDALLLEKLSEVACFSPAHFHRQFSACYGVTPWRYVQLMRLKSASHRLAFHPAETITQIALDAGFQYSESFSRAFRQVFGSAPREFRQRPDWTHWHQCMPALIPGRRHAMLVDIQFFPETRIAMLTHKGPSEALYETVARFIAWRKETGLSPVSSSQTFGIAPHDPQQIAPEAFQFHVCGSVTSAIPEDNPYGVVNAIIPGGRCAVISHQGTYDALNALARRLYADWLPASGESLRDFPLFMRYHNVNHDVAEHERVTDICLPLQSLPDE